MSGPSRPPLAFGLGELTDEAVGHSAPGRNGSPAKGLAVGLLFLAADVLLSLSPCVDWLWVHLTFRTVGLEIILGGGGEDNFIFRRYRSGIQEVSISNSSRTAG